MARVAAMCGMWRTSEETSSMVVDQGAQGRKKKAKQQIGQRKGIGVALSWGYGNNFQHA